MQPAAQLGGKKGLTIQQHNCKVNKGRPKYCTRLQSWESFCCDNIFGIPEGKEHCTFSSVCECREKSTPVEVNIHNESKRYLLCHLLFTIVSLLHKRTLREWKK